MREHKVNDIQPESTRHAGRWPVVAGLIGTMLLLMLAMVTAPAPSFARMSVGIFVNFGPPALPVYVQPPCPGPGYMWTPGYWAWDPDSGYYWVPGTWVAAPFVGALWTPGYWAWAPRGDQGEDEDEDGGGYVWYPGYWGNTVGFYGGVDYGYGYTGHGYYGGYWRGENFYYNREVNHITNVHITNIYNQRVVVNENGSRVSYNGGRGGIDARPTREQMAAEQGRRFGPVGEQMRQERFARSDRMQRASFNHGHPGIAATPRAGEFHGRDAVQNHAPVEHGNQRQGFQSFGSQRPAEQNARFENRAPVERGNQRPTYSNNQQRSFERNQPQARPQEMRRYESRPAPQQQGNFARQEEHGGGNQRQEFQSFGSPRPAEQNARFENRAPVERGNQRPTYSNNQQRSFERNQPQARPQEMRRYESRPAPQQQGNFARQEEHGGGNRHGGGNGGDNGHDGGGRH